MLAYLKLILNPTDNMAFLRVVNVSARGGAKAIQGIQAVAENEGLPCCLHVLGGQRAQVARAKEAKSSPLF